MASSRASRGCHGVDGLAWGHHSLGGLAQGYKSLGGLARGRDLGGGATVAWWRDYRGMAEGLPLRNLKEKSCFFPIPQAAVCVTRVVEKANAPVIYLSTDAASSETNLLQSLVFLNGKPVPLVKRPEHDSSEKWDALLYRNNLGGDNQVEAMLDKTICALSSVFVGSSGSTFTEDIIRLRRSWSSASQCDEYLCEGEMPNYIAENE